jgi:hypothetical protein
MTAATARQSAKNEIANSYSCACRIVILSSWYNTHVLSSLLARVRELYMEMPYHVALSFYMHACFNQVHCADHTAIYLCVRCYCVVTQQIEGVRVVTHALPTAGILYADVGIDITGTFLLLLSSITTSSTIMLYMLFQHNH